MPLPQAALRRSSRPRALQGHPWVFSGELERLPGGVAPGDPVDLVDARGAFVGRGFVNPRCTLALRLLTTDPAQALDDAFLARRLRQAVARRPLAEEAQRLVASEADGLPGLVADRYGEHVVVQATTAGMDRRLPALVGALCDAAGAVSVLARHDLRSRAREGLPQEVRQLHGTTPGEIPVRIAGMRFDVDPWHGQKTGFYLDQRDQYGLLEGRCDGGRLLDACCYVGPWSAAALRAGAREVVAVDSSGSALAHARRHTDGRAVPCEANIFDWMRQASDRGERFDGIVLDPPPFVRSRDDLEHGLGAYKELNLRALRMLDARGWLYTCCCSQRVSAEAFAECVRAAAADAGRSVRVLRETGQSADHPVLLEVPETAYLRGLLLEVA